MIPYGRQSIDRDDIAAVDEVLAGDWLTTGPFVRRFEADIAGLTQTAGCVAVTSGTAALHCAYAALQLEPGDEVITPPMTFVATQSTAAALGARIVFADICEDTGLIDPQAVREAVSPRTKAIVCVDYAGQPGPLPELREIATACGAFLVEDAAHSIGSELAGVPVGQLADLTTFSFFPTKNITTGEGGAVVSPDADLVQRARHFSNHGLIREPAEQMWPDEGPWHQEVHEFGLNYRLPDINAALGISQLQRMEMFRDRRQGIVDRYTEAFGAVEGVDVIRHVTGSRPFWHLFPLLVPAAQRKRIFLGLRERGIGVQVNYLPAHLHPVFRAQGYDWGDFPVAERFYRREISLPLFADLTDDQVDYVIAAVLDLLMAK